MKNRLLSWSAAAALSQPLLIPISPFTSPLMENFDSFPSTVSRSLIAMGGVALVNAIGMGGMFVVGSGVPGIQPPTTHSPPNAIFGRGVDLEWDFRRELPASPKAL